MLQEYLRALGEQGDQQPAVAAAEAAQDTDAAAQTTVSMAGVAAILLGSVLVASLPLFCLLNALLQLLASSTL